MTKEEYINSDLIRDENSIKVYDKDCKCYKNIMMKWEDKIMKRHADIVCRNGGDILEIGFGMGISANYIINKDINTYTIVEIHPTIIKEIKEWMKDKPNVILIEGDWFEKQDEINKRKYDGIFYDTVFDNENKDKVKDFVINNIKNNGIFTYFNTLGSDYYNIGDINIEMVYMIDDIPDNNYFNPNKKISKAPWKRYTVD